jgi:predicted porin
MLSLAACNAAHAQGSVTLYGIVDSGIEYVSHADTAGHSLLRMPSNTGDLPSCWGLKGDEDLGGGLRAQFILESGFNTDSGTLGQGGRLFGRQAWVGINAPYGLFSFGRQYSMTFWSLLNVDPFYAAIYGPGSLDAYLPNARSDNTIAYKGTFGGLTLGATYSFGRDAGGTGNTPGEGTCAGEVPGKSTECRQWSALIRYDSTFGGASVAYDEQRGGTAAAASFFNGIPPFPITSSVDKDTRAHINGYLQFGPDGSLRFNGGWIGRRVTTDSPATPSVSSNLYYLGASYLLTPTLQIDSEVYRILNSDQNTRATKATARATYGFSKRTFGYLQVAYLFNSPQAAYSVSAGGANTPGRGQGQAAGMLGLRHVF